MRTRDRGGAVGGGWPPYATSAACPVASPGKGHELAAAKTLLGIVPLAGRPVTGDALLTQRDICTQIVAGGGGYLLPVDANQPALLAAVAAAFSPWTASGEAGWGAPTAPWWLRAELRRLGGGLTAATRAEPKARHGRRETRQVRALADPGHNARVGEAGAQEAPWPHVAQVRRIRCERIDAQTGEIGEEISYAITSLPPERANARRLLGLLRGHWRIENRLHWIRDVTFGEDRSAILANAAPQAVAACRNLVLALRRAGSPPSPPPCGPPPVAPPPPSPSSPPPASR